ncbi:hypothetical protein B0A48_01413 [Cryoendolithus antarcticus]|uniref:Uncharacterized protein n=1 Tax=Cryoendolithus antarcticus TaxID=1507870 RepID=A0A1V8TT09_9PEZI|nr:hypothetical protein B0A48_01413 [Cryoendolithus antarcticus]
MPHILRSDRRYVSDEVSSTQPSDDDLCSSQNSDDAEGSDVELHGDVSGEDDEYLIVWEGFTIAECRGYKRIGWSSATVTALLRHAATYRYSAGCMPKVNTFLHLAREVGVPTEYGKECCEGALRRLATLITNRINDKALNPAVLTSKGSLETRTCSWATFTTAVIVHDPNFTHTQVVDSVWLVRHFLATGETRHPPLLGSGLSEKSLVREAMSVLVKGKYFKQCKSLDFQPTSPPGTEAFTPSKTFQTTTASTISSHLITPPSTIVSSHTATPAAPSPATKVVKSTVARNVLMTPSLSTTGETDVEPEAPGDSLRRCCKMTKNLLAQGNDALDPSNDPVSDVPAGLLDDLPYHTIQAKKRIGKWLRNNTGRSNPNAPSADSDSTFPGVDVPTPSHSDVSTFPGVDVPTPSHSDADSWDGDAVE